MIKKIIIILLVLIEIWSVTGVIITINRKDTNGDIQNEINNELNTDKDSQNNEEIVDEDDNSMDNELENKDEVIIDDNSTNSKNDKNNNDSVANNKENNTTSNNTGNNINKEETMEKPNVQNEPSKIISTETKTEDSVTTKYGVKITATKTYTVNTYSDGKVEKIEINSSNETYDKSGYNATTNDLKNEASGLVFQNKSIYNEILGYVNGYRSDIGRNNLILDDKLSLAATIRAMELAYTSDVMSISHTRPNGSKFWTIMSDMNIGYSNVGENIAADSGYGTPKSVTNSWKNSQGHYENMINENHGKMGVGYVELGGNKYWVQLFTN